LDESYWATAEAAAAERQASLTVDAKHRGAANEAISNAQRLSFEEFARSDAPAVRLWAENPTVTQLGPVFDESVSRADICGSASETAAFLYALRSLQRYLAVGDIGVLDSIRELLCAERCWAAPCVMPRIHETSHEKFPLNSDLKLALIEKNRLDLVLYEFGRARAKVEHGELVEKAGGEAKVSGYLDQRHREVFFLRAHSTTEFSLDASQAWPGCGWGLREYNATPQYWRWIGASGAASLLAKLEQGREYLVTVWLHTVSDPSLVELLCAEVGGEPLCTADAGYSRGYCYRDWIISAPQVLASTGDVEIVLRIPEEAARSGERVAVAAITCRPSRGTAGRLLVRAQRWLDRWAEGPPR